MNENNTAGESSAMRPQVGDPRCASIQIQIENDTLQMQALQSQLTDISDPAVIHQINVQIAGLQQSIAMLQQQAQALNCPGADTAPAFDDWMRE
jgi:hypothetical protein